ncbi:MAG: DUF3467 domain-containing protein [Candidatus Eisenbacteria bacterium]
MEKRPPQQIKVELTEPAAEGIYSNWVMITYSPSEFIIDFGRFLPGLAKTKVYSRIIMTPQHVKNLLNVLKKNVTIYEEKFGEIKTPASDDKGKEIGF